MITQNKQVIINRILKIGQKAVLRREEKQFEASSMGDIAFLLLIFFIVTSSFILRQGLFFTLPSPKAGSQMVEKELLIEVSPRATGYMYDGKLVDTEEFEKIVQNRVKENSDVIALVYMEDKIKYNRLVDTLSLVQKNGVKKVSVKETGKVTEEKK